MDKDTLLTILEKFDESTAVTLSYKEGETKLLLKKEGAYKAKSASQVLIPPAQINAPQVHASSTPVMPTQGEQSETKESVSQNDANLITVKSPIVGTFYRQPSPDAPAFVEEGSKVQKGTALCILEAMKMMNTLESEYDGVIESILVSSGDLVEFEQDLFIIRVK
ncbi:MAG: acetyl-CoA carboxylase biotin carboxyl carrier protein [Spirochaetales bacterium]